MAIHYQDPSRMVVREDGNGPSELGLVSRLGFRERDADAPEQLPGCDGYRRLVRGLLFALGLLVSLRVLLFGGLSLYLHCHDKFVLGVCD